ncbi:hypothetical protein BDV98DRAFT_582278 [Pterulicium gracile]|uniref:Uncharacterized protein n=1 Tax=Pterulicium gracile TaxID=1884261 RepID=A0A5C3QU89_9AGAR|nr:hypothetical protein BDV98DRAFT_582278 [Pterula gracilis]
MTDDLTPFYSSCTQMRQLGPKPTATSRHMIFFIKSSTPNPNSNNSNMVSQTPPLFDSNYFIFEEVTHASFEPEDITAETKAKLKAWWQQYLTVGKFAPKFCDLATKTLF